MWPIGPLMHEHRLIERMVGLVGREVNRLSGGGTPEPRFLTDAVEFFRSYADRCHHGKEEEILFKELETRELEPALAATMAELVEEHKEGRRLVGRLEASRDAWLGEAPGAKEEMVTALKSLAAFYPGHIEKEDKHFFHPVMEYLSREEMDAMLERFHEFDRGLVHELYGRRVDDWDARLGG